MNSKRTGFEEHMFWENVKALPLYTEDEYQEYVALNQKEVNRMIDDKLVKIIEKIIFSKINCEISK